MQGSRAVICFADGGCRKSNPSDHTYGSYKIGDEPIVRFDDFGPGTNNTAEHEILHRLLEALHGKYILRAVIYSDSQLAVRQILGQYAVRAPHLEKIVADSQRLLFIGGHDLRHTPRKNIVRILGH